jgi:hypothetical protein
LTSLVDGQVVEGQQLMFISESYVPSS